MESGVKEELDDNHHYENEIDKKLDERNERLTTVIQLRMIWKMRLNLMVMISMRSMLNK